VAAASTSLPNSCFSADTTNNSSTSHSVSNNYQYGASNAAANSGGNTSTLYSNQYGRVNFPQQTPFTHQSSTANHLNNGNQSSYPYSPANFAPHPDILSLTALATNGGSNVLASTANDNNSGANNSGSSNGTSTNTSRTENTGGFFLDKINSIKKGECKSFIQLITLFMKLLTGIL